MPASRTVVSAKGISGLYRKHVRPVLKGARRWYRRQVEFLAAQHVAASSASEPAALDALHASTPRLRWEAAITLGRSPQRSAEAIAKLIEALGDDEPFVRWQAVEALARQDVTCVFHALSDALTEGEPLQRAGAAEALGRIGGEAATAALQKQLGDFDPRVRRAAAWALGRIADPTTLASLDALLEDEDSDVRRAAARALGRIGNPAAATALAKALAQPGQGVLVRRSLAAALASSAHPDAQPAILNALADLDPQVRGYSVEALGHVGNEVAYERLAALLPDRSPLLKGTVGDAARAARSMMERRGRRSAPGAESEEPRP